MSKKPYRVGRARTGLGLFAIREIKKGEFIAEYRGRRLTTKEANVLEIHHGARYMYELNSRWTVDGSSRSNIARYANHSCRPNAESDVVKGKVIIRAIKRIVPGHEITYDYGEDYFNYFIKKSGCKCVACTEKRRKKWREAKQKQLRKMKRLTKKKKTA